MKARLVNRNEVLLSLTPEAAETLCRFLKETADVGDSKYSYLCDSVGNALLYAIDQWKNSADVSNEHPDACLLADVHPEKYEQHVKELEKEEP